jgi:hypothetical protein
MGASKLSKQILIQTLRALEIHGSQTAAAKALGVEPKAF